MRPYKLRGSLGVTTHHCPLIIPCFKALFPWGALGGEPEIPMIFESRFGFLSQTLNGG